MYFTVILRISDICLCNVCNNTKNVFINKSKQYGTETAFPEVLFTFIDKYTYCAIILIYFVTLTDSTNLNDDSKIRFHRWIMSIKDESYVIVDISLSNFNNVVGRCVAIKPCYRSNLRAINLYRRAYVLQMYLLKLHTAHIPNILLILLYYFSIKHSRLNGKKMPPFEAKY